MGLRCYLAVHPEPYLLVLSLQAFWASVFPSVKCELVPTRSKAIVRPQ